MKTNVRLPVITNSQRATFRRCQREHHYAYELGYRALESVESLRFGTLFHNALEAWWKREPLEQILASITRNAADFYEAAKARALIRGYDARWADDVYDVVAIEVEFRAPLINPETGAASRTFELGGKIDVLLRDGIVEHKTTSSEIGLGSAYWRRLTLDAQVSAYYAGAKSLGYDVTRCVYDVVRKPAQRPSAVPLLDGDGVKIVLDATGQRVRTKDGKKWRQSGDAEAGYVLQTRPETAEEYESRLIEEIAANPDRYYQRGDVVRLEEEERDAALDTWQTARAMREGQLMRRYPRNPDGCERYGRLCQFFSVCTGTADLEDPVFFTRVDNVHQELSAEAAE